jgi:hypothetical protein
MTAQTMKIKPDFNIYIINDNADMKTNRISIFTLLMTTQMMKAKLDFNIYINNDKADNESKTGFQYLHY